MFRKILLSYFPKIKNTDMSPIYFHLKLLSPKLFYWISTNYAFDNRRYLRLDLDFSYFQSMDSVPDNAQDDNFFYSYKIFSNLNGFNNYNFYVVIQTVIILVLKTYYEYFSNEDLKTYIKPLLYSFNYVLILFFSRFKQYEDFENDNENIKFMLILIEEIIVYLEYTKDDKKDIKHAKKIAWDIKNIVQKDPDILMFVYKITKKFSQINEEKPYTDILFYEYLISAMLDDLNFKPQVHNNFLRSYKTIFAKRYSNYISGEMIMHSNLIIWDKWYLSYLTNSDNFVFFPYFLKSLDYINNINLNQNIDKIVDQILDFNKWWTFFVNELKNFNANHIDMKIDPNIESDKIQDIMTKDMMKSVKKISNINEQFLDYYILLVSRKINKNWDNLQTDFLNPTWLKTLKKEIKTQDLVWEYPLIKENYINMDRSYFQESSSYKKKKERNWNWLIYNYVNRVISYEIQLKTLKNILMDFCRKSHKEYLNWEYLKLLKNNFQKEINYFINSNDLTQDYLKKYYFKCFDNYKLEQKEIKNFKENIYYPDFIVYYKFLKYLKKKFDYKELLIASRFKNSLLWYLIVRNNIWYDKNIEKLYLKWVNFYDLNLKINLENFFLKFKKEHQDFLDKFSNIKQNKKFIKIMINLLKKNKYKNFYLYDNLKDITYYNKRIFRF